MRIAMRALTRFHFVADIPSTAILWDVCERERVSQPSSQMSCKDLKWGYGWTHLVD